MASIFGPEDSDGEHDDIIEVEKSETESLSGFEKWRKRSAPQSEEDDDESDGGQIVVKSRKERALEGIQDQCDKLDITLSSNEPYAPSFKVFTQLCKSVEVFHGREKSVPDCFLDVINLLTDELNNERLTRESMSVSEWKALNQLRRETQKKYDEFRSQIDARTRAGVAEAAQPGGAARDVPEDQDDWSEEGIQAKIIEVQKKAKGKTEKFIRFLDMCKQQQFWALAIHLCGRIALSALEEESNPNFPTARTWRLAFERLQEALTLSLTHKRITVSERALDLRGDRTYIDGGIVGLAQKIYASLVQFFQWNDVTSDKYMQWVREENNFLRFLDTCLSLPNATVKSQGLAAAMMLDIVHCRTPKAHAKLIGLLPKTEDGFNKLNADSSTTVSELYELIREKNADAVARRRATLQMIYHEAVCNRYETARDTLLRSKVLDHVSTSDDHFKILANRTIAQVGLSAFRLGLFNEAHSVLNDLCSRKSHKVGEALGQNLVSRRKEDGVDKFEAEVFDRARLVPPHRNIPVDVLTTSFLVLSMLLDTVAQAKNPFDIMGTRNAQFTDLCRHQSNAPVVGEPVELNDFVYVAYQSILRGDVPRAVEMIHRIPAWQHLADRERTLQLLVERIKTDSLRVFLITEGCNYVTLTIDHLCGKFQLPQEKVYATVSRLLQDSTVVGSWDFSDKVLTIERGTLSKFHHLAKGVSERIAKLAEYNAEVSSEAHSGRGDSHRAGRAVWMSSTNQVPQRGGRGGRGGRGFGGRGFGGRGARGRSNNNE